MIQGISSVQPVIIPNIIRLKHGTGKITVPLKPSQSIYARFKHITAIPARMNGEGVPVYKLRMLDNLIERLIGQTNMAEKFVRISPETIDTLISNFKQELSFHESSVKAYNNIRPQTGLILNTFA
ncbi:MAG: hypothetical protein JXB88_16915 [Spirochaetales bacterium]|nr:hypothetical protein [Spirochaetales bacterium]